MKTIYRTVEDMQGEEISLAQEASDVEEINRQYCEEYNYYLLDWNTRELYGTFSFKLHSPVYYVGEF